MEAILVCISYMCVCVYIYKSLETISCIKSHASRGEKENVGGGINDIPLFGYHQSLRPGAASPTGKHLFIYYVRLLEFFLFLENILNKSSRAYLCASFVLIFFYLNIILFFNSDKILYDLVIVSLQCQFSQFNSYKLMPIFLFVMLKTKIEDCGYKGSTFS